MDSQPSQSNHTIRISFSWVLFGLLLVFAISLAGGSVGSRLAGPPLPPLTDETNQLITTVQEVTISPSMAAADLVNAHHRSVMLLADASGSDIRTVGTAVVITSDGVIVSTQNINSEAVVFDNTGSTRTAENIGTDDIYGLTYYQLEESVIPPFELAGSNPGVGASLMALSRNADTTRPRAITWQLEEYIIPEAPAAMGWQRIARFAPSPDSTLAGSPLLTDDGNIAAMISDPAQGTAIPVDIIRASLDRLTANNLETNQFETWGIGLTYQFRDNADQTKREFAASIASVTPGSPAEAAGLRAGDTIQTINETEIEWTSAIARLLERHDEPELTVMRGNRLETILLTPPSLQD